MKTYQLIAALLFFICPSAYAQQTTTQPYDWNELDRFQSSVLGVTFSDDSTKLVVKRVWESLAGELAGLKAGDEIKSIHGLKLTENPKGTVKKLLTSTPPGSVLNLDVLRDDEWIELSIQTDSHATRNAKVILDHLVDNTVVNDRLLELKTDFMIKQLQDTLVSDIRAASSPRRAIALTNSRLRELNVSHLAVVPKVLNPFRQDAADLGIQLKSQNVNGRNRYFISELAPAVAQRTSLTLGDEVVRINRVPASESSRLWGLGAGFTIEVKQSETITLDIRKTMYASVESINLLADQTNSTVTRTKQSVAVHQMDNARIGYIHLVDFMSFEVSKTLKSAIEDDFQDCDGIIADLRGHGGLVPVGMQVEKSLKKFGKPVFAIIDGHTSSAKEICAYRLKKLDNLTLVGHTTAGSVLGATFSVLPSGDRFIYPAVSGEMLGNFIDKVDLEGVGVEPDILIDESLPYSQGKQLLLEQSFDAFKSFLLNEKTLSPLDPKDEH